MPCRCVERHSACAMAPFCLHRASECALEGPRKAFGSRDEIPFCPTTVHRQPNRQENKAEEVIINGLSDTEWSYFSFESGTVVGRSELNNKEQDAQWANRKDWDIAICGDYIKTNGGTSGNGFAGAQINTTSTYDALTEAPADGYLIDTLYLDR